MASLINTLLTQQKHVQAETGALWTKVKDWNLFEAYCTAPAQTTKVGKFPENLDFLEVVEFLLKLLAQ